MLPQAAGSTPALAVARAFGDRLLAAAGVMPTPDLAVLPRSPAPAGALAGGRPAQLLVVASDGLWGVVENEEAVATAAAAGSPAAGAAALLAAAAARWGELTGGRSADDITVAVAWL